MLVTLDKRRQQDEDRRIFEEQEAEVKADCEANNEVFKPRERTWEPINPKPYKTEKK